MNIIRQINHTIKHDHRENVLKSSKVLCNLNMLGHLEILSHLNIHAGFKQLLLDYVNISLQVSDRNVFVFESEKREQWDLIVHC